MSPPILNESALPHLRGLLEVLRLQRLEQEPAVLLERIAEILGESLGFRAVVVNLYRPQWDDFEVVAAHGNEEARDLLLGTTTTLSAWAPMLDERFRRGDVYFIPHGELDWSEFGAVYLPALPASESPDAWHPEDGLIAPMLGSDGSLLGILSVDEPESGAVPGDEELELLSAVAAHLALSIDAARAAAVAARDRASLANLLEVSARLNALETAESVLGAVTRGIQHALGFEKVVAAIADGAGGFVPRGAAGWRLDDPTLDFEITAAEVATILDPDFEIEGCYLLPREVAVPRVPNHRATPGSKRPRAARVEPALADRAARRPGGKRDRLYLGGRSGGFAAAVARAAPGPAHVREPGERRPSRGRRSGGPDPAQRVRRCSSGSDSGCSSDCPAASSPAARGSPAGSGKPEPRSPSTTTAPGKVACRTSKERASMPCSASPCAPAVR